MNVPDDLISTNAAARILGVHFSTLYRWREEGVLRAWRVGGRYRYSEAEVRAKLEPSRPVVLPESGRQLEARAEASMAEIRAMGLRC